MSDVFAPNAHKTIAVTAASAEDATLSATDNQVRLYNATTAVVFVRWGTTAQTAVATDLALAPGSVEAFTKFNATRLAAICPSGTGNLYVTTGNGE